MLHAVRIPLPPGRLPNLPLFDSFPYITTRFVPAAHHILLLPDAWTPARLLDALERQVAVNGFDAALVLGPNDAVYLSPGHAPSPSSEAPRSGIVLTGRLHPAAQFDPAALGDRAERLEAFGRAVNSEGYINGDQTKGGRLATRRDARRFAGPGANGVPRGLERCSRYREWRGWCLDHIPGHPPYVVPVHCLCQNTTRCGRCLEPLRERRVGGNEYRESDGRVWHWPGFMALSHQCSTTL